jgi:hypothetical protein
MLPSATKIPEVPFCATEQLKMLECEPDRMPTLELNRAVQVEITELPLESMPTSFSDAMQLVTVEAGPVSIPLPVLFSTAQPDIMAPH